MRPYLHSWWIRVGIVCLIIGTGPLASIMLGASLRLTDDPNPNPVLHGMLAGLTFWPSLGLIAIGIWRVRTSALAK